MSPLHKLGRGSSTDIKAFFGTSENAVRTQIWIAITVYVLLAVIQKELALSASLYQILEVASVTIFERVPILQGLSATGTLVIYVFRVVRIVPKMGLTRSAFLLRLGEYDYEVTG